ncbi:hypothetical protein [Chryseobacterium sp.]|uniref:hypothetical protein n=1 Tax=Chryseobacterium sp. TaxID=1871047 RepID=UPI0028A1DEF7|nr:hypothetical protein [Chryseobacterium sp.]
MGQNLGDVNPDLVLIKKVSDLSNESDPALILTANTAGNLTKTNFSEIKSSVTSGVKGEAIPTSSPTTWNPGDPDLYEKWDVKTAGTYTNFKDSSDAALVVTTDDLADNFVQFWVKNGVSQKVLSQKPENQAKTVYDPTDDVNPATMKAAADRWDKTLVTLRSFVEPLDTTIWESMPFPAGETNGAVLDTTMNAIPNQYGVYGVIPASSLANVTKLKLKADGMDIFGGGVAWWIGRRADNTHDALVSGRISSGVAEITLDPQYTAYLYSRPTFGPPTLEKQPKVILPVEEDSVMKRISLMASGYSGVLDLATLGLKESNTAEQNTTIINQAIESQAGKSDAKHIKFPGGQFKVNEIKLKPGTAISGAGYIHTRLYTDEGSTARTIFRQDDGQAARGSIRDIFVDARNTTEGGIYLNNTYDFQISNLVLYCTKQFGIWHRGGLCHSIENVYFMGADIGVKTTHLTAMATNLIVYNRLFFVKQVKKCVELNEGSNYCFTSCIFEDSGTSGDDSTGGVHAIGLSPNGEGVDVTFNNCYSEGVRGGFIYKIENCYGNSAIRDCMLYNGGNGAGIITNAVVNFNSRLLISGTTRFSEDTPDSKPFPTNVRALNGFTYVDNPNINIGTNNVGTILKAQYS